MLLIKANSQRKFSANNLEGILSVKVRTHVGINGLKNRTAYHMLLVLSPPPPCNRLSLKPPDKSDAQCELFTGGPPSSRSTVQIITISEATVRKHSSL